MTVEEMIERDKEAINSHLAAYAGRPARYFTSEADDCAVIAINPDDDTVGHFVGAMDPKGRIMFYDPGLHPIFDKAVIRAIDFVLTIGHSCSLFLTHDLRCDFKKSEGGWTVAVAIRTKDTPRGLVMEFKHVLDIAGVHKKVDEFCKLMYSGMKKSYKN